MADFNALEALINAHIKKNGVQAITGNILNGILRGMVSALGKGYTIAGVAVPSSDPGTMTGPLAYLAYTAGTYTHFGGLEVGQGEVSMLIYNEAEWHKEVLFILSATATVDDNVGTPEVGVSFVDGLLTFDFRNMKGNPGNDGDAAGFGTITATVDGNVGTPGVSVQSSGPDTAKNITFQFTNLKGETGVTSVVATVDNTVGTPTCTVSLVGQQLTLAFSGLKGAQGDTGSSVDYPFTIVNNLTTNDATQALSAAMGVQLEAEVSQLEAKVTDLEQVVGTTHKSIPLTVDQTGYYVYNDGRLMTSPNFNLSAPVHLQRGQKIAVRTAAWDAVAVIAKILESGSTPYQALVVGTSVGSLFVDDFSYTATEECDVVISGYVSQFPATAKLTYSETIENLKDAVADLERDFDNVSEQTTIIESERVLDFKDEAVSVSIEQTGAAVKDDGTIATTSSFNISAPIKVRAGQKVTVIASGWTSIAIIAKVVSANAYAPLVLGTSTGSLVSDTFSYVATEDCEIVISSYINNFPSSALVSYSNTVVSQRSAITKIGGATAIPVNPVRGGWYNTYGNGTVGSIATLEYTENTDWENLNILVNAGDVFYVTGRGGNSPRLWAFLDATTNEILAFSGHVDAGDKTRIVAPKDCRLVINIQILLAQPYGIWKEQADFGSIRNIENFSRLDSVPSIPIDKINYFDGFAGIIHHWGFIGDSLMSGFFDNTGASNYEYSWGQRMCKKLGVEGYNFSRGGQTVKGWIEDASSQDPVFFNRSWGGAKTNLKQAYIIGLGVNDKVESYGVGDVSTDVGTYDPTTDTDTNANTYAGYYAGIIQRVRSVQPNAPIFLVNMPQGGAWNSVVPYNEVIADLVSEFENTYLIDLFSSLPIFGTYHYETSKFWTGGHLNPAGYEYIASVIMQYIDWIIRNNYAAFSDVNLIPFTE